MMVLTDDPLHDSQSESPSVCLGRHPGFKYLSLIFAGDPASIVDILDNNSTVSFVMRWFNLDPSVRFVHCIQRITELSFQTPSAVIARLRV